MTDINARVEAEIKKRHLEQSSNGGKATLAKHGTAFYKELSKKGFKVRMKKLAAKKKSIKPLDK